MRHLFALAVALAATVPSAGCAAQPATTSTPPPSLTPAPTVSEQAKAQADQLLGAATSERQAGHLAAALNLAAQALAKWPGYADARSFLADIGPRATATARAVGTAAPVSPATLSP